MEKFKKFWAYKVLPLVYDSSLSYLEVLQKLVTKINEVITTTGEMAANVVEALKNSEAALNTANEAENTAQTALDSVPTKTSELTNDSGFVNESQAADAAPVQSVNGETGVVVIPDASTSTKGIVQLSSSTISNAQDKAATPRAVMQAYDNGTKAQYTAKVTLCQTAADVAIKEINISLASQLINGTIIYVIFQHGNTAANPQLRITSPLSTYPINSFTDTAVPAYLWNSGEIVPMLYYDSVWLVLRGGRATTDYYGATRLNSSTDSTSETAAATPAAVKAVKDAIPTKISQLDNDSVLPAQNTTDTINLSGIGPFGFGYASSTTNARVFIPLPNNARDATITYSGTITLASTSGTLQITAISVYQVYRNGVWVAITTSGMTSGTPVVLKGAAASSLTITWS